MKTNGETGRQSDRALQAFGRQAGSFDEIDRNSRIIAWMREQVHRKVSRLLQPPARILELNAGTGIDAIRFAGEGFHVHATEASAGMLKRFREKLDAEPSLKARIGTQWLPFEELRSLDTATKYDLLFSNFGGLNCATDIKDVASSFSPLIRPGGYLVLVMLSPFCLWESLFALKGNFRLAFRRWKRRGVPAHLEEVSFPVNYFTSSELIKACGPDFRFAGREALGLFTPPPYLEERFGEKKVLGKLHRLDEKYAHWPVLRAMGDHYLLVLQKKG